MKEGWSKKKRVIVIAIILFAALILLLFGTQIALWLNFILGNDVVIKLSVDWESLQITRGEQKKVTFEGSVTTNPFCSAACSSQFENLAKGITLDEDSFTLRPGLSKSKEFMLEAPALGAGYGLYRFTLACHGVNSFLCHTKEEPITRSALVVVRYDLSDNEKQIQVSLKQNLLQAMEELESLSGLWLSLKDAEGKLQPTAELPYSMEQIDGEIEQAVQDLQRLQSDWQSYNFFVAAQRLRGVDIKRLRQHILEENTSLSALTQRYNSLLQNISENKQFLLSLDGTSALAERIEWINNTVQYLQEAVTLFTAPGSFEGMQKTIISSQQNISALREELKIDPVRIAVQTDLAADALCRVASICAAHPSIVERVKEEPELNESCSFAAQMLKTYQEINATLFTNETTDVTEAAKNIIQNMTNAYLDLAPNITFLERKNITAAASSNTALLVPALMKHIPVCELKVVDINDRIKDIIKEMLMNLTPLEIVPPQFSLNLSFPEPALRCCLFGACQACCDEGCKSTEELYPIVFIHGHAFNKDVSFEYSLDAFHQIQEKLGQEGYVNAGAISVYTKRDTPPAEWGVFRAPFSIKASYYVDLFQTPENYVVVQQKSESIDTYAVRLKELLDTIEYKTGRQKVVIIAHSMGGLVVRRYLQIFGSEKVDRMILIGTPNQGIVGDSLDYCGVIGEERECRDMDAGSVFMNKLQSQKLDLPVYTIVGVGCEMTEGDGDGVVLKENGGLKGTKEYEVRGDCDKFMYLHTEMLNIERYPQVMEIILKALKE
ncbi:alpha/beta fold hydrolase [Candidatus Woesearchaeota archaeon]|nr:alpha/beta fold hydrolase [Candidatus Woesearchaeota archaeon]